MPASRRIRYALLDRALARGVLPDSVLRAGSRVGRASGLRARARGVERRRRACARSSSEWTAARSRADGERQRAAL